MKQHNRSDNSVPNVVTIGAVISPKNNNQLARAQARVHPTTIRLAGGKANTQSGSNGTRVQAKHAELQPVAAKAQPTRGYEQGVPGGQLSDRKLQETTGQGPGDWDKSAYTECAANNWNHSRPRCSDYP